jgi:hypothetical protein
MPLVSRDRFARATRAVDAETLAAFVADLSRARGYEVDRPGEGRLRLEPGGRVLAVRPGPVRDVPPAADAVVAPAADRTAGGDVVDADTLYRQLHYAVDRSVARDLLATHLGLDPDREASEEDPVHLGGHPLTGGGLALGLALVATVVLAGALAVAGVAELPGGAGDLSAETPIPTPAATATPPADRNGDAIATGDSSRRTPQQSLENATEQLTAYPPGVDERGLADIDTLIAAHRSVLSNTSFTVTVQYREFEDGRVTGTFVETVRVERPSRYAVSVDSAGTLETTPRAVVGADAFSNENRTWVRLRSTEPYVRSRLSRSRMLGQLARYLRWSLSVENSTLREHSEGGTYRITTDGDPYQGITDASGTAYVTDEGLVTYGRWTYTNVRPETRVEFSIHTTDVGSTTVSRPRWIDTETGNESDGS